MFTYRCSNPHPPIVISIIISLPAQCPDLSSPGTGTHKYHATASRVSATSDPPPASSRGTFSLFVPGRLPAGGIGAS